jgi:hypothetical protein
VTDGSTQQQGLPFQEAEGIVAERSELLAMALQRLHVGVGIAAFIRALYDRFRQNADWQISYQDLSVWLCMTKSSAVRIVGQAVALGLAARTSGLKDDRGWITNSYRLSWEGVLAALKARPICPEGRSAGGIPMPPAAYLCRGRTDPGEPDETVAVPAVNEQGGSPSPARGTPIQSKKKKDLLPISNPIQEPIQSNQDLLRRQTDLPPMIGALAPEAAAGLVERLAALDDPAQLYGRVLEAIYQCVPELRESRYVAMEAARLVSDGTVYGSELRRVLLDCRAMRESRGGLRNAAGFFHAKVKVWPGWREPIRSAARARDKDEPP